MNSTQKYAGGSATCQSQRLPELQKMTVRRRRRRRPIMGVRQQAIPYLCLHGDIFYAWAKLRSKWTPYEITADQEFNWKENIGPSGGCKQCGVMWNSPANRCSSGR